jgi:hypothetical protein
MSTKADERQKIVDNARLVRAQLDTMMLTMRATKEGFLRSRGWKEIRSAGKYGGASYMWSKKIAIQPEVYNALCTMEEAYMMQISEDL